MKAQLIDGKRISAEIKAEAAEEAAALKAKGITPCLAVVLVGDDSASQVYVNNKKKACEAVGIRSVSHVLSGGTTEVHRRRPAGADRQAERGSGHSWDSGADACAKAD